MTDDNKSLMVSRALVERRIHDLARRVARLEARLERLEAGRSGGVCYCPGRGDNYHSPGDPDCVQTKGDR